MLNLTKSDESPTRAPELIEQLLSMVDPDAPVQESEWKDVPYKLTLIFMPTK